MKRLQRVGYVTPFISLGLLFYVWTSTQPSHIGPAGILLVFVLLYIFWVSVLFIVVHGLLRVRVGVFKPASSRRRIQPYYISSILAFAPVLILAMQSVNQLTIRDILLVFLLVGLAIFYIVKRT